MRVLREDIRVPDAKADLYLVGLGIGGFARRTMEADEILSQSAAILHLTAYDAELKTNYSGDVVNLQHVYEAHDHAADVYTNMTNIVMEYVEANNFLGSVVFLTYGHPLFLVDTGWELIDKCQQKGLRVKPLAAISFVDQVLCDIGKRFDSGVQMYEADLLVTHRVALDSRFPLLVSQIGEYGTSSLRINNNKVKRLHPLFEYLQQQYPGDRRCTLIMSSWREDMAPKTVTASIADITSLLSSIHTGCSLYVDGKYD